MKYYLGIDCGGTFIKAAIYDANGVEYGVSRYPLTVLSPQPGWAERDLNELWQSCIRVIRDSIQKSNIDSSLIKSIGISAQGKGLFLLDKMNKPLGNGILSSDQRSLSIVQKWQEQKIPSKLYPITRQTLWTGHPVSILNWLKSNQFETYQNIGSILMSHDYLRYCLTGNIACEITNISESNLYNMNTGLYDKELAYLLDIPEIIESLPPVIHSSDVAGYISVEVSELIGLKAGTPVVGGLFDVVSTALCADLDDETKLNVVLGTWSVVSGITDHIDSTQSIPFVYGKYAQNDKFIVHEASPTSAANLEWFTQQWEIRDYNEINRLVENLPKASSSVFFIPFLYGSNAGLGMQAGFYGIQSIHDKSHLLQAIYEGVIFSLMYHLERMLQRFPETKIIRVTGGPAKSSVWMQILADLTGITIEIPQISETGCLGAALMAMESDGIFQDGRGYQEFINSKVTSVYPDSAVYEIYRNKYKQYKLLLDRLKDFNEYKNILN